MVNLYSPNSIFCSSSHKNAVEFVVPHTTSNARLKRIWKSDTLLVRYLPDEANRSPPPDSNFGDVTMDIVEKQNLKPLKLTPPIVVVWVYHLLRSMAEGITFKKSSVIAKKKKNHSDRFSQFDRDDNIKPIPFRLAKAISNQAISPESYLQMIKSYKYPLIKYM